MRFLQLPPTSHTRSTKHLGYCNCKGYNVLPVHYSLLLILCISVKSLAECVQSWFAYGLTGVVTFLAPGHLRVQSVATTTLLHSTVKDLQMLRTHLP
jgi:hypothetical protein